MKSQDKIERVIIKLPKAIAAYFRSAFPHGKRSDFVARCILDFKHQQQVLEIESELRKVSSKRQK